MPIRKSVVALQIGLILLAVLFFNTYYTVVEVLSHSDVGAKSIPPEFFFLLGILCVAGSVILFLFVRYETPYRG